MKNNLILYDSSPVHLKVEFLLAQNLHNTAGRHVPDRNTALDRNSNPKLNLRFSLKKTIIRHYLSACETTLVMIMVRTPVHVCIRYKSPMEQGYFPTIHSKMLYAR